MPRVAKAKPAVAASGGPAAKKPALAPKKSKKLYARPEKIPEGTVLTDLTKTQWRIGPSIGTGGFGEIYSATRAGEKKYDYVVKCEPHGNGPLFVEMHFYMRNARQDDIQRFLKERGLKALGMPYMIGNGSADINGEKHRFIVMPRYGTDIARHFLSNGRRIPEGTAYRLALQMLDVYEFVHSCGYVHADLKGANILLGYGKGGAAQAYLVDYGLASHFTTKEFKPDPKKMHNGTIEYTSRDAHQGVPTMRADMEILGYNLIEWLGVQLPWVRDKLLAAPVKVQKAKEEFIADVGSNLKKIFPNGVPVPIAEYMKYVAKLEYNETPDYEKCRKIFTTALRTMKITNSGDLIFDMKNASTSTTSKNKNQSMETSVEEICASEDDEDDVVFEKKTPVKAATPRALKTVAKKASPQRKVIAKGSPQRKVIAKASPQRKVIAKASPQRKVITKASPQRKVPKTSPQRKVIAKASPQRKITAKASPSPIQPHASPPLARRPLHNVSPRTTAFKNGVNRTPSVSPRKRDHTSSTSPSKRSPSAASKLKNRPAEASGSGSTRSTPVASKANINFSPAISVGHSGRLGKTVINDSLTPNPRPNKTYEFNFELDVSMDANVIVNVKRKKKLKTATPSVQGTRSSERSHSSQRRADTEDSDTPVSRVKVRKLGGDEDASSPRTPAVTVKKSRH